MIVMNVTAVLSIAYRPVAGTSTCPALSGTRSYVMPCFPVGGSPASTEQQLLAAHVQKRSKWRGIWRDRWLVLTPSAIHSYRSSKCDGTPTESFQLRALGKPIRPADQLHALTLQLLPAEE